MIYLIYHVKPVYLLAPAVIFVAEGIDRLADLFYRAVFAERSAGTSGWAIATSDRSGRRCCASH